MKKQITILMTLALFACKKEAKKPVENAQQNNSNPSASFSWKIVNHDSTKSLSKLKFYNSDYGYFISDNYILRTKNGGQSFTTLPLPVNAMVLGITLVDSINIILSYNYSTYKSNDGCETWTPVQTSALSTALFDGCFINSLQGFIGGDDCVLKTTDGGISWEKLNIGTGDFYSVKFTSNSIGWADNGSGVVYRTTDGGSNGISYNTGFTNNTKMYFLNDNVAFAYFADFMTTNVALKKTTNGGLTWETVYSNSSQLYSWTELAFTSLEKGFAAGWAGYLSATSNSGSSWQQLSQPSFSKAILSFCFLPDGTGWACGLDGLIMRYN